MDAEDSFEGLFLTGVEPLNREVGRGAYGRVFTVKYHGTTCAAKELRSDLVQGQRIVEIFLKECDQCSRLRHLNIVKFLGVYYPAGGVEGMRLPVMVMEMMAQNLTSFVKTFVDRHEDIPIHLKFSIINDVALGLYYLHSHTPPIIHRDLSPNNILLTDNNVAKIGDIGVVKVVQSSSKKTIAPSTIDFMPPEVLDTDPKYGPPVDVFSFAGIILHVFTQQWPTPLNPSGPKTRKRAALSEVGKRSKFLDLMTGKGVVLKPLIEECLDEDPTVRPTMVAVCEKIQEAPPLVPALTSGRYHIKWTQLADLPVPLYGPYVAVQDRVIYVAGHDGIIVGARAQVYAYDVTTDHWSQLPTPGQVYGIPQIIGGRLSIIGGHLSDTVGGKVTNKIVTFNKDTNTWISCHPDLLTARLKPGVVTHLDCVVVLGGMIDDNNHIVMLDDIEVLNWEKNSQWIKVPTRLPAPMWCIYPTISDGNLLFVGYSNTDHAINRDGYKIPMSDITSPAEQHATWTKLASALSYCNVALVPNLPTPLVIGGHEGCSQDTLYRNGDTTANIEIYNESSKSWKKIDSLSFARTATGVAAVGNNAIVVIGGHTNANDFFSSVINYSRTRTS